MQQEEGKDTTMTNPAQMQAFPMAEFLQALKYMINTDSGHDEAGTAGCWKLAAFLAEKLTAIGMETETISCDDGRPLLVAKRPAQQETQHHETQPYHFLLIGHLDTVFPAGTAASRPFQQGIGADADKIFGPGTVDMKAGALLMIYLAKALLQQAPDAGLCLAFNSDEEIGSDFSAPHLFALGEQSRYAFIFEGGRKKDQFVYQRKGCAKYRFTAHGIASHAGTAPQQGASAIIEMAHFLEKADRLKRLKKGTSINIGLLHGGTALNVVPDFCQAEAEVRYTDDRERLRVETAFRQLTAKPYVNGTFVEVDRYALTPPLQATAKTYKLMDAFRDFAHTHPDLCKWPVDFISVGGLSDANRLAACGIPVIDGCGPGGGFPHSEKEFLRLETLPRRFFFLSGLLRHLLQTDQP